MESSPSTQNVTSNNSTCVFSALPLYLGFHFLLWPFALFSATKLTAFIFSSFLFLLLLCYPPSVFHRWNCRVSLTARFSIIRLFIIGKAQDFPDKLLSIKKSGNNILQSQTQCFVTRTKLGFLKTLPIFLRCRNRYLDNFYYFLWDL